MVPAAEVVPVEVVVDVGAVEARSRYSGDCRMSVCNLYAISFRRYTFGIFLSWIRPPKIRVESCQACL